MGAVPYLPADPQAAEPVQVSEGALHDPAVKKLVIAAGKQSARPVQWR